MDDLPPLPDHGWSREVISLKDAFIVPPTISKPRTPSGVWKDGDIAHAANWRHESRMSLPLEGAPQEYDTLKGRYLFGGMFYGHFGHVITETIARMWAWDDTYEGLLLTPKHANLLHIKKHYAEFFRSLGVEKLPLIIAQPTLVEELDVPGQAYGLGKIAAGTPEFRSFVKKSATSIEPSGAEKIFISRVNYIARGGLLGERVLESNLIEAGYQPFYPEKHSWPDQLAAYKAAKKIVSLDSSALHLVGLVADQDTDVAIILRRNNDEFESIRTQINAFSNKMPVAINSLVSEYRENTKRSSSSSWGVLDFADLRTHLVAHDFISASDPWVAPDNVQIDEDVTEARRRSPKQLTLCQIEERYQP